MRENQRDLTGLEPYSDVLDIGVYLDEHRYTPFLVLVMDGTAAVARMGYVRNPDHYDAYVEEFLDRLRGLTPEQRVRFHSTIDFLNDPGLALQVLAEQPD